MLDAKGTTTEGMRIARTLALGNVSQVLVEITPAEISEKYSGGPADVTFKLVDGTSVKVVYGFGVGYSGTGPTGVYDILVKDLGLPEDEAKKVFVPWNTKLLFHVK